MKYVCTGALLRCSMGTSTTRLIATPKNVSLTGEDQANIADYVSMKNIPSFGRCRSLAYPPTAAATAAHHGHLTPMPCVPGTCPKWKAVDPNSLLCGEPALLQPSKLRCMFGGTISIVNPGQTLEEKKFGSFSSFLEQSQSKKEEVPEEVRKQIEEIEKPDTEGLKLDSVLDGIQLALDGLGMVPVLGAVPDLLNASVSVLRGDWIGAGLSIVAAVPIVGDIASGAKLACKGAKYAKVGKKISKSAKNVPSAVSSMPLKDKRKIAKKFIDKDVTKKALLKEPGVSSSNVDEVYEQVRKERKYEAYTFYKQHTLSQTADKAILKKERNEMLSQLNGIDYNYKIEKGVAHKGDVMYQFGREGRIGNYFTHTKTQTPTELGVAGEFYNAEAKRFERRELYKMTFKEDNVPFLRSTAKEITDTWSNKIPYGSGKTYIKKVHTKGGGIQTFIPGNSWKKTMKILPENIIPL